MSERMKMAKMKISISKPVNYRFENQGRLIDLIELAIDALESYKHQLEKF